MDEKKEELLFLCVQSPLEIQLIKFIYNFCAGVMSSADDGLLWFYEPIIHKIIFCIFFSHFSLASGDNETPSMQPKACEVSQYRYSHYKCDENGDIKCLPGRWLQY